MNIYVGNLSYKATEEDVKKAFEDYGEVSSVKIITDHETGKSKGFAFVEMTDDDEASKAISALEGSEILGREIKVNEARPRKERSRRY